MINQDGSPPRVNGHRLASDMKVSVPSRPSVALVGAGTQGRRLAFMWSSRGQDVHLIDAQPNQLQASLQAIDTFRASHKPKGAQWGQIITHLPETRQAALQNAWLVIECVPEQLPLKQKVIADLDSIAPEDTIIASNSSSYSCNEILEGLTLKNGRRFLSVHSYWPPETCELEIMGHETTSPHYIDLVMEQSKAHGFIPFQVKSQSMGYIYNRIWAAIKREALLAASEGAATPKEIDAIFRGVLKTPKGPFEQMDVVGLDVVLDIEQHYADARGDIPIEPREYLNKYLKDGHLGVKSGKGFYDYSESAAS
ncbi:Fc.00g080430.m01.CDS01 [Cosmosporella sp. VM-42]